MANRKKIKSGIGNLDPGLNPGLTPWIDAANNSHGGSFPGSNPGPGPLPPESTPSNVDNLFNYVKNEGIPTSTAAFAQLLLNLQGGNDRNNSIASLIEYISRASEMTDENKSFFTQLLSQLALTDDQRKYDFSMLQESRLYNNPHNALARLMGAGISRDAAIQLLNSSSGGSSGSGSVIGSGTGVSVPSFTGTPGAQDLQKTQVAIGGAADIIGALCNLLNSGMSFAQGVESVKQMRFVNFMNKEQQSTYENVNKLTQALQSMQLEGILEPSDVDSWQNADDVYKWLYDHADTNAVKPLISSGVFKGVFGSTLGRNMFNNHWHQQRDSRDYGTQLNQLLRQNELVNDLKEIQTASARRQYYTDFVKSFQELVMNDEEIGILWNQYCSGAIEVQINGVRLDISKYARNSASRNDFVEESNFTAYKDALKQTTQVNKDGSLVTMSGQDILNYNAFARLIRMYENDAASIGLHGVLIPDKEGGYTVGSARERYAKELDANLNAVITGAFINDVINNNRLSGYSGDLAPIYKFADMWNASGLGNVVSSASNLMPNVPITINNGDRIFNRH